MVIHLGYGQILFLSFKYMKPYSRKKIHETPAPFKWIWKAKVTKKLKIFTWPMFRDQLNSRNIIEEITNFKNTTIASYRTKIEEYTYRLFFQCPFSVQCWALSGTINYSSLTTLRKPKVNANTSTSWHLYFCLEDLKIGKCNYLQSSTKMLNHDDEYLEHSRIFVKAQQKTYLPWKTLNYIFLAK